uniref:Uncharacterized protein n=1 Tax=Panagrolaimus davidi TaxID=227884 RepID=A0A914QBY6_9BILA
MKFVTLVLLAIIISLFSLNNAETLEGRIYDKNDRIEHQLKTINESNNEFINGTFDYYVCGENSKAPYCECQENGQLKCDAPVVKNSDYENLLINVYFDGPYFTNANIKIMNESFIPKTATFNSNQIKKLEKDKILPGNEATVETLEINSNGIEEIENGAFNNFSSLKSLDLSKNSLSNISARVLTKEIGSSLKKLDLSHNPFTSTDSFDFTNLEKLEELILDGIHIYLSNNYEKTDFIFPKSLSNLKKLSMRDCGIISFNDKIFDNLINLETLDLYGNYFSSVPESINQLTNLQSLNLGHSFILNLNETSFKNNQKLSEFSMVASALRNIDNCTFCKKPNLKKVMLYQNRHLSYIHENAFGNVDSEILHSLETFSVESCNLSIIPEKLLNWNSLTEFGIGKNPFICNCSMAWLINDLLSPTHSVPFLFRHMKQRRSFSYNEDKTILEDFDFETNVYKV